MDANRTSSSYELKDDLARLCLPPAYRDSNRKLAWTNSICILFLIIGVAGMKPGSIHLQPPPPVEEVVPTVVEPLAPQPQTAVENQNQEQNEPEKTEAPQVVVVTPESPNINFSVPTIGNVVAPAALSKAPPLAPMKPAVIRSEPVTITSTGTGGERPQPPYPGIARERGLQGSVILSMTVDDTGVITAIQVKESSGYSILDRSTLEFVKTHWVIPPGKGSRIYEATITYRLKSD